MRIQELVSSIKRHEGLRLESYQLKTKQGLEPFYTIGYGHRLSHYSKPINIHEAELYLYQDIIQAINVAMDIFPNFARLNDYYQNFVIEMCYNMGYNLKSFIHANTALVSNNINIAIREYRNSTWRKQVGENRVEDMMNILRKGYKEDN